MLLLYVRHGDPIYRPDSLTERGEAQAMALVSRMERCRPDRIFSSTSRRAILTALPTARRLHLPVRALSWCHESLAARDFMWAPEGEREKLWFYDIPGESELLCSNEIRSLGQLWYTHPHYEGKPYEQGVLRIRQRTDEFLLSLGYRHDRERHGFVAERPNDERIALFAHHGFGLLFLSELMDIPYPLLTTHFSLGHSGVTAIHFKGEGFVIPKILQLSNDSHLFASGMETKYNNGIEF